MQDSAGHGRRKPAEHATAATQKVDYEYPNRNLLSNFSRNIAALRVKDAAENAAIPTLVSFLDIYNVRRTEELDVWRMWNENHTYEGLRSTIGCASAPSPSCWISPTSTTAPTA